MLVYRYDKRRFFINFITPCIFFDYFFKINYLIKFY